MAPERKKLFGCPSCGFRATGLEDACPRCGAKFGEEARFECPFCGETVPPSSKECPSCRISYDDFVSKAETRATDEDIDSLLTEIIEIESRQVKEEAKKLSCPKCSWMVHRTEEKCPKCGTVFSDAVAYQCPVCAALVSSDAEVCEECSSAFVSVEAAPPVQEKAPEEPTAAREEPVPEASPVTDKTAVGPEPEPEPVEEKVEEAAPAQPVEAVAVPEEAPEGKPEPKKEPEAKAPATPASRKARVRRRKLKAKPQQ